MKPPRFIGIFPSKFPGWSLPSDPQTKDGMYPTGAFDISCRFIPHGVSGVDTDGQIWCLVDDYGVAARHPRERLRWVRFPVEVVE